MVIQPIQEAHHEAKQAPGQFCQDAHFLRRTLGLVFLADTIDNVLDLSVKLLHWGDLAVLINLDDGQRLCTIVLKLFLHHKGKEDIVPVIEPAAGVEPIHPRAQHQHLGDGSADDMEKGIFKLRPVGIFLRKIRLDCRHIKKLRQHRLVIASIGDHMGRD